jgi:antitoxin HigA-1
MDKKLNPVHPGEVLEEEFLKPLNISKYRLAKEIGKSPTRIGEIVSRKREVTAETALLLAKFFGTSPEFWLNLQAQYDLEITEHRLHGKIEAIHSLGQLCPA